MTKLLMAHVYFTFHEVINILYSLRPNNRLDMVHLIVILLYRQEENVKIG